VPVSAPWLCRADIGQLRILRERAAGRPSRMSDLHSHPRRVFRNSGPKQIYRGNTDI
jgi:hypothetical protein